MKIKILLLMMLFFPFGKAFSQQVAIIPQPAKLQIKAGQFTLDEGCLLQTEGKHQDLARIAGFFNDFLQKNYGFQLKNSGKGKVVVLKLAKLPALGNEGYQLSVDVQREKRFCRFRKTGYRGLPAFAKTRNPLPRPPQIEYGLKSYSSQRVSVW